MIPIVLLTKASQSDVSTSDRTRIRLAQDQDLTHLTRGLLTQQSSQQCHYHNSASATAHLAPQSPSFLPQLSILRVPGSAPWSHLVYYPPRSPWRATRWLPRVRCRRRSRAGESVSLWSKHGARALVIWTCLQAGPRALSGLWDLRMDLVCLDGWRGCWESLVSWIAQNQQLAGDQWPLYLALVGRVLRFENYCCCWLSASWAATAYLSCSCRHQKSHAKHQ